MAKRIEVEGDLRYLGTKGVEYAGLDTFKNPGVTIVRMTSDEVTSMCPITGAPDFEIVDITYAPRELCVESKALKMYLQSLRDTAGFVEALAHDIAEVIANAIVPEWVRVDVTQKARGGISIVASCLLEVTPASEQGDVHYWELRQIKDVAQFNPPANLYLERAVR